MAETESPPKGQNPGLSVIGYGAWTALGPDGPSTVAGLQARLHASQTGSLWDPTAGAALPVFRVEAHQWWTGPGFLPELCVPVIEECLAQVGQFAGGLRRSAGEVPVLVAVAPQDRPRRPAQLETDLASGIARRLGRDLPQGSVVMGAGRVGLPHLLALAARQIDRHPVQILLGVESFLAQPIIERYITGMRLLCGANSSGFIAGEAAAAVIVTRRGMSAGQELAITGIGAGREASRDGGSREAPVTADGLTRAMRAALSASGRAYYDIPHLFGDVNGEHFKFKEAAIATMRLDRAPPENRSRRPRQHVEHWNVIEGTGEIGAALMPLQLGWAFEAARQGRLPQGRILAFAGEDDGARVALVAETHGAALREAAE